MVKSVLTFGVVMSILIVWSGMIDVRSADETRGIGWLETLCSYNSQLYFKPAIVSVEQEAIIGFARTMSGYRHSNERSANALHVSFFPLGNL